MSKLSAQAPVFVPEQFPPPEGSGAAVDCVSTLPRYMTSCYPFVKGDVHHTSAPHGPGHPAHSHPASFLKQRQPPGPHAGSYAYNGTRPPGPITSYPQRHIMPATNPMGVIASPGTPTPIYQGMVQESQHYNYPQAQPYYPQYQTVVTTPGPVPLGTSAWGVASNPACVSTDYVDPRVVCGDSYPSPGQYYTPSETGDSWCGAEARKKVRLKKKPIEASATNTKSIGIQNESGVHSRKKIKTKTIILLDVANQTDFSEDVANLTLAERPNSLFKKKVRPRRKSTKNVGNQESTDSEEVDSDSGYSSPMHRRNQISNGTHPLAPGVIGSGLAPTYPVSPLTLNGQTETLFDQSRRISESYEQYLRPEEIVYQISTNTYDVYPGSRSNSNPTLGTTHAVAPLCHQTSSATNDTMSNVQNGAETDTKTGVGKKRRKRARRKKTSLLSDVGALSDDPSFMRRAIFSSNVSRTSEPSNFDLSDADDELHFEDDAEFPDLMSSSVPSRSHSHSHSLSQAQGLSYSQILKTANSTPALSQETRSGKNVEYKVTSTALKEGKNSRKRRKRRDLANLAAEKELAEITIEQQMLKEIGLKPVSIKPVSVKPVVSTKKSKQPISLNLSDMIDALAKQPEKQAKHPRESLADATVGSGNQLDSTAPAVKRGKERETPKAKKPSSLKKVILKEREEKKKLRILDGDGDSSVVNIAPMGMCLGSDLSQDALSSKGSSMGISTASADMSPISQTSPISMSPLSPGGSPLNSGVNSPVAGNNIVQQHTLQIHSRRFREYCTQVLDKDVDSTCTLLLQELVRFQDRLYHKDPQKAKNKRRIVLGLREVTKHLKLKKIKCVVISPNLERIQSKGGLDDALNNIMYLCQEQDIPFVFALGRRALGRACAKLVPVSVCGVFNYEGAEEYFQKLMDQTEKARGAYNDMVAILEEEAADNKKDGTGAAALPLMAHMGHSRTPSACSAISFSSILSEADTRSGDTDPDKSLDLRQLLKRDEVANNMAVDRVKREGGHSRGNSLDKITIIESIHEIDEGHEADTEDYNEMSLTSVTSSSTPSTTESVDTTVSSPRMEDKTTALKGSDRKAEDTLQDLPHIDSIHHTSCLDLNAEILSQHSSSKTLDPTTDTVSSSAASVKTVGEVTTPPSELTDTIKPADSNSVETDLTAAAQKLKLGNNERIESWVVDAQNCMENLELDTADTADTEPRDQPNVEYNLATPEEDP